MTICESASFTMGLQSKFGNVFIQTDAISEQKKSRLEPNERLFEGLRFRYLSLGFDCTINHSKARQFS